MEITGRQIKDNTVQRKDIDITTVGQSLVTKIIQGTGVTISSTGGDSGTGDVIINATAGSSPWITVEKLTDEVKTSNAVLANDAYLLFPMAANAKYGLRATILFDTGATEDFKFRLIGPASPILVRIIRQTLIPGATNPSTVVDTAYSAADIALAGTGTTGGFIQLGGVIYNGATAGNFIFQWSQNTSGATQTIVRAGSFLEYFLV